MLKIINIAFSITFLFNLICFGKELNDIKYINDYIKNMENLTDRKISYITNITFKCYYYYNSRLKSLEKEILDFAKSGKKTKIPLIPSKDYSYCPKVLINISSSLLEPEGIFRRGIIIINYDTSRNCIEKKMFGIFEEKICRRPNFNLTLMHELAHFAFSKVYGNIKFRKILFRKYEICKKENCLQLPILEKIVAYRNFYDEFPAILFANIWSKLTNCNIEESNEVYNYRYFLKTTLFLSKREFLSCKLNNSCGVFYLYRQLKNVSDSFNLCLPKKEAFKSLILISINEEKKDLLPLVKKYLRSLKKNLYDINHL